MKSLQFALALLLSSFLLFTYASTHVYAAKKFVKKTASAPVKTSLSSSVPSVVKFRPDRLGILLSFSSFRSLDSITYSFTYTTNGIAQGAGGTITANNNPTAVRELLFGTCSTGVCRYHDNITNARLTLTAKFSNGKKITKIYTIKK